MKLRPILFSTAMVMALLDGTKTQTRRIVKPQPKLTRRRYLDSEEVGSLHVTTDLFPTSSEVGLVFAYIQAVGITQNMGTEQFVERFSRFQPGDVLWVRETLYYDDHSGDEWCYQAGNSPVMCEKVGILEKTEKVAIPSIHMPFIACRLFLQIKSVRVERVQDISREDAIAEGIERVTSVGPLRAMGYKNYTGQTDFMNPVISYQSLWGQINSPESWAANPFVWVVEFEQVDKPA